MTDVVTIERARVEYDGSPVLIDATVRIGRGEFVALLGENGSGKTTLLRALLGLVPLSSGSIDLLGTAVARFDQWDRIAYVPQRLISAGAVPVSVQEVVASTSIGPRSRWGRRRRAVREAVRTSLEAVGLWDRRSDRIDELSGGQQRRVLIAAALAKGADVFLLDEPTAGVDAEQQAALTAVFRPIRDAGGTVVLVTHELGPFRDLASRVVILDHGRVAYDGPPPGPSHGHDAVWHHSEDSATPPRRGPLDAGPLAAGPGVHAP